MSLACATDRASANCQTPYRPSAFTAATEDERFAVLIVSNRGKGKKGNALFVLPNYPDRQRRLAFPKFVPTPS
jgi:hypothetical protein